MFTLHVSYSTDKHKTLLMFIKLPRRFILKRLMRPHASSNYYNFAVMAGNQWCHMNIGWEYLWRERRPCMLMKFRSYRVLGGPCHRLFLCSSCLLRFLLLVRSNIFDYCIDSRSVTSGEAPYGWILMWQSNHKTKKVQFPNINLELWYEEKIVKNIIVGIVKNSFQCFSIKSFFFIFRVWNIT